MNNSFNNKKELENRNFGKIGKNVKISRNATFYSCEKIKIGDNTRIDDFCIISGKVTIGKNVHISAGCYLFGGTKGIVIEDYVSISSRSCIYAISDDYSGEYMANPTIDDSFRNVIEGKVVIEKYSILGTCCTVLPNVVIGEGCAIGAMSLIKSNTGSWGTYVGIPCKRINKRSRRIIELVEEYEKRK